MAQYFLSGWIQATPGEGSMPFELPPDSDGAECTFRAQNPDDEPYLTVTGVFLRSAPSAPGHDEDGNDVTDVMPQWRMVDVKWVNTADRIINFDYDIAPTTQVDRSE